VVVDLLMAGKADVHVEDNVSYVCVCVCVCVYMCVLQIEMFYTCMAEWMEV
jgi:hypothetical protein